MKQRTDLKRMTDLYITLGDASYGKLKIFIDSTLIKENLSKSNKQIEQMIQKVVNTCSEWSRYTRVSKTNKITIQKLLISIKILP